MSDEPVEILPAAPEQSLTEEDIQQAASWRHRPALDAENEQGRVNQLHLRWLQEHRRLLGELAQDLRHVIDRAELARRSESRPFAARKVGHLRV